MPAVNRPVQLTHALYGDRLLPTGTGRPLALAECLRLGAAADRRATIEAYWLARQRAAQYQALVQQDQWLKALVPVVLERGTRQPAAMLQLRAARLVTTAAELEASLSLLEAQFELAKQTGQTAEPLWPLPSSIPSAGQNLASLDAQAQRLTDSWPLRQSRSKLPLLDQSIQSRTAAILEADAARAAATASYPSGGQSLEQVLVAIDQQTTETLALLDTLTDYNRALAAYSLTVLPPVTLPESLAAGLVAGS